MNQRNPASDPRERIHDAWHGLLFVVRRSRRYHLRREQSFSRLHLVVGFLTAVSGSATFATVLADLPAGLWLAAATAIFGGCELVSQPFSRALTHRDLMQQFTRLEKDLQRRDAEITEALLQKLQIRRRDLEQKGPPPIRVIEAMCHNEEVVAGGHGPEHLETVRWYLPALASLFDLRPHGLRKSASRP